MNWIEIKITVDGEAAEAVADLLQRYGHQGLSIEQIGNGPDAWDEDNIPRPETLVIRAYLRDDEHATAAQEQLESALGHMNMMYPMPTPTYSVVDDTDWGEAWKQHYRPIRIGKSMLIRPVWIDVAPGPNQIDIALDPGMAFGTGTHPTTQLCLESLERVTEPGMSVLDLGCGSGILSIAAAKLGASTIYAVDIDPLAEITTRENAEQNGVAERITAVVGNLETVLETGKQFDLIVVNILARVILEMCRQNLGDTVRSGGHAIFSGIIQDQVDDVENALRQTGLEPINRRTQGDWVSIEARCPI